MCVCVFLIRTTDDDDDDDKESGHIFQINIIKKHLVPYTSF